MLKKLQAMLDNDDRLPVGERYLEALEKHFDRLKNRKKRPRKPVPSGRAALVERQKKARN